MKQQQFDMSLVNEKMSSFERAQTIINWAASLPADVEILEFPGGLFPRKSATWGKGINQPTKIGDANGGFRTELAGLLGMSTKNVARAKHEPTTIKTDVDTTPKIKTVLDVNLTGSVMIVTSGRLSATYEPKTNSANGNIDIIVRIAKMDKTGLAMTASHVNGQSAHHGQTSYTCGKYTAQTLDQLRDMILAAKDKAAMLLFMDDKITVIHEQGNIEAWINENLR